MNVTNACPQEPPTHLQDIRSTPTLAGLRPGVFYVWSRRISLLTSDIALLTLAWVLAQNLATPTQALLSTAGVDVTIIPVLGISISIFVARKLYFAGGSRRNYFGLVKCQTLAVLLLLLISYFYNLNQFVSGSQFLGYWGLSAVLVCLGRFGLDLMLNALRRQGHMLYPAMIIASPEERSQVVEIMAKEGRYRIEGLFEAQALDLDFRETTFEAMQKLGVVEVFVSWDAIKNRMFLGQRFQSMGMTLRVIPDGENRCFSDVKLHMLNDEVPCITFDAPAIAGIGFWIKRLFDFSFALVFILLASPIYLALALAIYIDSPGPIFYKQTRIGLHGNPFKVWKFRSMVPNADQLQAQLENLNETKDGVLFKVKDDPRITRMGKFIRQYSLDELPQIFNVLLGEMSLVGPRPLPLRDVEKFQQHYFIRQDVLPGITGMWQVSGRSDIDNFDDVMKLDLYYIQNWSIWLDINILFRTFAAVLKKSGAY